MSQSQECSLGFELPGTEGEEIHKYRFRHAEFLALSEDIDVLGISLDSCYAHQEFTDRYDIPFPLLSDPTGRVPEQFGLAYDEWEHHKGVPKRALLTIDDSQSVRYRWQTEDAYESPNYDELRGTVRAVTEG